MIYEDIIKTEINNRKGKDTSKNTYITSLIKILKKYQNVYKDNANIDTFNYYDKIIEILPSKITTRKNYIIAILVLTRNNPKYKNVYKKYLEYSQSIKKEHLKYVTHPLVSYQYFFFLVSEVLHDLSIGFHGQLFL